MDSDDDPRGARYSELIYISSSSSDEESDGGGYGSDEEESDCGRDDYEVRDDVDSMREKVSAIVPLPGSVLLRGNLGAGRRRPGLLAPNPGGRVFLAAASWSVCAELWGRAFPGVLAAEEAC